MQQALDKAVQWAEGVGLTLSPSKSLAVIFSRKKLPSPCSYNPLRLGFDLISFENEARYLGVILDRKLTYSAHIRARITKCKKVLMTLRRVLSNTWGPVPWLVNWTWQVVVRAAFTYACFIWGQATEFSFRAPLRSLQRLALAQTGNFRTGTPSEGLEIITNNPPLDLLIKSHITKSYVRLYPLLDPGWDGVQWSGRFSGHVAYAAALARDQGLPPLAFSDFIPRTRIVGPRRYRVIHESFGSGNIVSRDILHCYTDGSKDPAGHTGIGVVLLPPDNSAPDGRKRLLPLVHSKYVGLEPSVFQAEILAILEACHHIFTYLSSHKNLPRRIIIYSDSQAALQALNASDVNSRLVQQCVSSLNSLGSSVRIYLRYVKAHVGHKGNEMADKAAKLAARRPVPLSKPLCFIPRSMYNQLIRDALYTAWQKRWDVSSVSQTKVWFPTPRPKASRQLLSQPRKVFSRFVRFITGHCFLRYQRALVARDPLDPPLVPPGILSPVPTRNPHTISPGSSISLTPPPPPSSPSTAAAATVSTSASASSLDRVKHVNPAILCRYCHRHLERAVEVITTCEYLWAVRLRTFGVFTLNATSPQWSPRNILRFLADPQISEMEKDETINHH